MLEKQKELGIVLSSCFGAQNRWRALRCSELAFIFMEMEIGFHLDKSVSLLSFTFIYQIVFGGVV
jgi:hypothetical protein